MYQSSGYNNAPTYGANGFPRHGTADGGYYGSSAAMDYQTNDHMLADSLDVISRFCRGDSVGTTGVGFSAAPAPALEHAPPFMSTTAMPSQSLNSTPNGSSYGSYNGATRGATGAPLSAAATPNNRLDEWNATARAHAGRGGGSNGPNGVAMPATPGTTAGPTASYFGAATGVVAPSSLASTPSLAATPRLGGPAGMRREPGGSAPATPLGHATRHAPGLAMPAPTNLAAAAAPVLASSPALPLPEPGGTSARTVLGWTQQSAPPPTHQQFSASAAAVARSHFAPAATAAPRDTGTPAMQQQRNQQQHEFPHQPQSPSGFVPWPKGTPPPAPPPANLQLSDHQRLLFAVVTYFKNYFAVDASESAKGLETMSDEDALGLSQCIYTELFDLMPLLRGSSLRSASAPGTLQPQLRPQQASTQPHNGFSGPSGAQQHQQQLHEYPQQQQPQQQRQQPQPQPQQQQQGQPPPQRPPLGSSVAPAYARSASTALDLTSASVVSGPGSLLLAPATKPVSLKEALGKMRAGSHLVKYGRNGTPKLRFVSVRDCETVIEGEKVTMPHLTWASDVRAKPSEALCLLHLMEVTPGASTPSFKRNREGMVLGLRDVTVAAELCFSLTFAKRTVELYAPTAEEFRTWVDGLRAVLARNQQLAAQQGRSASADRTGSGPAGK